MFSDAAAAATFSPDVLAAIAACSVAFWRTSVSCVCTAPADAGVQAQQRDLHGDDPAEHQADQQDARAAAQEAVDDAVVRDPAEPLEGAGAAAVRRAAGIRAADGPETRRG